jgi:hypothetical protein
MNQTLPTKDYLRENYILDEIENKDILMQMENEELEELALNISENAFWKSQEAKKWFDFKISQMQSVAVIKNRVRR